MKQQGRKKLVFIDVEDLKFRHRKSGLAGEIAGEEVVRYVEVLEGSEGGKLHGEYTG